jgi:hypothetical protein
MGRSLRALETPGSVKVHDIEGSHLAWQRNAIVRQMAGDWLCFIDSDQVFEPNTLLRLLAWKRPIVGALIAGRYSPFPLCAFRGMRSLAYEDLPSEGLVEVDAVGTGFLLIERAVFNRISDPWFEMGKLHPERAGEDTYFCQKAREAGFAIAVDCGVVVGHETSATVFPQPGKGVRIRLPGLEPLDMEIGVTQEQTTEVG